MHVGIDNSPCDIIALVTSTSKSYDINVTYRIDDAFHSRIEVLERSSDLGLSRFINRIVHEGFHIFRSAP